MFLEEDGSAPRASRSPLDLVRNSITAISADPVEFLTRVASELSDWPERHRVVKPYAPDADWHAALHGELEVALPCQQALELTPLWDHVLDELSGEGIQVGPMSFLGWNDGDAALIRAIWCLARHHNAHKVVETGVAHGVTSRFIIEAILRNGGGHLWSIDLPPQLHPELHGQIGVAVPNELRGSWTYIRGSSRRRLGALLRKTSPIDLFIHDSKHSTGNVLFELRLAWTALRTGGAVVVDDIDANDGFRRFCEEVHNRRAWICEAEPVRPDERRANKRGLFGVILKTAPN
jgi:hypothetical protein